MKQRDQNNCPNRCMIDCRANLRGGECKAPFIEVPETREEPILSDWKEFKYFKLTDHSDYIIRLRDGSEIKVIAQSDGDFYWELGLYFIIPSAVTHFKEIIS